MTDQVDGGAGGPLTDAQIDALDIFSLAWMAPRGQESVRLFARAILAAAEPVIRAREWRPIETAPRAGFIIAGSADEGWAEQAYWDDGRREWWSINTDWTDAHGAPIYPTHWMPLPEPPAIRQLGPDQQADQEQHHG